MQTARTHAIAIAIHDDEARQGVVLNTQGMVMDPQRGSAHCPVCGKRILQARRGRAREVHVECKPLHDALLRIEKALDSENLGPMLERMTPEAQNDLWSRLQWLSNMVPRVRNAQGHFVPVKGSQRQYERKRRAKAAKEQE